MSKVSRSRTRKILFQILYSRHFGEEKKEDLISSFFSGKFVIELDKEYLTSLYNGVISKEFFLLGLIAKYAPKFKINTMNPEYVLPIFIGAYEMFFYEEEIPSKVSINESIELAKTFSDDSAKKFVNGVMNSILNDIDNIKKDSSFVEPFSEFSFFK